MLSILVLASLAAEPMRLVHSVGGVTVGVVELEVSGGLARYRARHVFRGQSRSFETSWPVDAMGRDEAGLPAELASLWTGTIGCRDVREERTGKKERLCVAQDGTGSIDSARIRVVSGPSGFERVDVLHLGQVASRFERSALEPTLFGDPFAKGFEISGKGSKVALSPRADVSVVPVTGLARPLEGGSCLELASKWAARVGAVVQLGLVVEQGRAWPHAWVRTEQGEHVDPSIGLHDERARTYLAFHADAGPMYLELVSKARRVVRTE